MSEEANEQTQEQQPTDPTEVNQPLTTEEELDDYKGKYLRLLADIDNTRKRMQKERQEMTRFAVENVISEILTPIDNMENALQCAQNMSDELRNWAQGFLMILGQFKDVLGNHGVSAFNSTGSKFDPQLHDAIETEETTEAPPGTVMKEYVKGYRSKERTVRPARVKVSVAPGVKTAEKQEAPEEPHTN